MSITGSIEVNIFHLIKLQYNADILGKVRRLERTEVKYANYTNHVRFSLRYLHNYLLPNQ